MKLDNARIAGTKKYCTTQPSILIEGVQYTPTQVTEVYQNDLDALAEVATARLALAEALTKAKATATARQSFDKGFKLAMQAAYGNSPGAMGTFGITIRTPKAPTAAVKAAAVSAAAVTRKLHHPVITETKASSPTTTAVAAPPATIAAVSSGTGGATPKS